MASAVMSRASVAAAPSAARPSSAPARTARVPVASAAVGPRPATAAAAAGRRGRASAVTPQAFYGSSCNPCTPNVRMMRVPPRFFRRGGPVTVMDSPIATLDWLARTVAQPLQPMETATYEDRYELTSDVPGMGPEVRPVPA